MRRRRSVPARVRCFYRAQKTIHDASPVRHPIASGSSGARPRGQSGEEERYTGCNPGAASGRMTGMLCIEIGFKGGCAGSTVVKANQFSTESCDWR